MASKFVTIFASGLLISALSSAAVIPPSPQKADLPTFEKPNIENTAASAIDETWRKVSDEDDIQVYRRSLDGSSLVEFRGEGTLDAPLPKVAQVLLDTPRKLEWVDRAKKALDIRQSGPLERIEYNHTAAPWPVKDRDFLFQAKAYPNLEDLSVLITLKSVEDAAMPEQDCCVRGHLERSSYFLKALDQGRKTKLIVQIHADPRGGVPNWIVNMIQKSWPRKTLESLRKQVAKPDVTENAFFRDLLDKALARNKSTAAQ